MWTENYRLVCKWDAGDGMGCGNVIVCRWLLRVAANFVMFIDSFGIWLKSVPFLSKMIQTCSKIQIFCSFLTKIIQNVMESWATCGGGLLGN